MPRHTPAPGGPGSLPPRPHRRRPQKKPGSGACDMWIPIAIPAVLFYALPRLAWDTWKEKRRG